jgi:hypothetical protein
VLSLFVSSGIGVVAAAVAVADPVGCALPLKCRNNNAYVTVRMLDRWMQMWTDVRNLFTDYVTATTCSALSLQTTF